MVCCPLCPGWCVVVNLRVEIVLRMCEVFYSAPELGCGNRRHHVIGLQQAPGFGLGSGGNLKGDKDAHQSEPHGVSRRTCKIGPHSGRVSSSRQFCGLPPSAVSTASLTHRNPKWLQPVLTSP